MKPYIAHYIAELEGVEYERLNNSKQFKQSLLKIANQLHLTLVDKPHIHRFEPHGLSLIFILAESHLAAHTWPEMNFMNVDVQVCSAKTSLEQLGPLLEQEFKPTKISCGPVQPSSISEN